MSSARECSYVQERHMFFPSATTDGRVVTTETFCNSCQNDEEEDLVVDLSSGSLQATSMRSWLLMSEVVDKLQKL